MRRHYSWGELYRPYLVNQGLADQRFIDALIDVSSWFADDVYDLAFPASDPRWPRRDFGVGPDWCALSADDLSGLCSALKQVASTYGLEACKALPRYPKPIRLADGRDAVMIGRRQSAAIGQRANSVHGAMVQAGAESLTSGWLTRAEASAWRIANEVA